MPDGGRGSPHKLIMDYDWDGVNCAELYFEGPGAGFLRPDQFTPMHPTFRQAFQQQYHVDPAALFAVQSPSYWRKNAALRQALIASRTQTITSLHEELLRLCARWRAQKPYLHTTLTVVDSLLDAGITECIGVDSAQLLALGTRYPFLLLIEDPFTLWGLAPERYRTILEHYRRQAPPAAPLAMDISIVARNSENTQPTAKQRGLEFYLLLAAAQTYADSCYLYAENTLEPADMPLGIAALGDLALTPCADGQLRYSTKHQFLWQNIPAGMAVYVDDRLWPCRSARRASPRGNT